MLLAFLLPVLLCLFLSFFYYAHMIICSTCYKSSVATKQAIVLHVTEIFVRYFRFRRGNFCDYTYIPLTNHCGAFRFRTGNFCDYTYVRTIHQPVWGFLFSYWKFLQMQRMTSKCGVFRFHILVNRTCVPLTY